MSTTNERWKPPHSQRITSVRTEPAVIAVRTDFMYSERQPDDPTNRPPHCFCYRSLVTDHGSFGSKYEHFRDVDSTVKRMIAAFGDDADLEIEVRRRLT